MLLNDNQTRPAGNPSQGAKMEDDKQLEPKFLALKNRLNGMVPEGKTDRFFLFSLRPHPRISFPQIYPTDRYCYLKYLPHRQRLALKALLRIFNRSIDQSFLNGLTTGRSPKPLDLKIDRTIEEKLSFCIEWC